MSKALLISSLRGDGSAFFVVFSFLGFTFLLFPTSLPCSCSRPAWWLWR